jgi:hypothetical protein
MRTIGAGPVQESRAVHGSLQGEKSADPCYSSRFGPIRVQFRAPTRPCSASVFVNIHKILPVPTRNICIPADKLDTLVAVAKKDIVTHDY